MTGALDSWSAQLAEWAIPEHILAAAPESPWVLPQAVFVRRADRHLRAPAGATYEELRKALSPKGTVLDVGAAAGAASLPAGELIEHITAVDVNEGLLTEFAERAAAHLGADRMVRACTINEPNVVSFCAFAMRFASATPPFAPR